MSSDDEEVEYVHDTIRCICGFDDDDGFTVQCETCYVWQHCACIVADGESLPEQYFCDQCNPNKVAYNVIKAIAFKEGTRTRPQRRPPNRRESPIKKPSSRGGGRGGHSDRFSGQRRERESRSSKEDAILSPKRSDVLCIPRPKQSRFKIPNFKDAIIEDDHPKTPPLIKYSTQLNCTPNVTTGFQVPSFMPNQFTYELDKILASIDNTVVVPIEPLAQKPLHNVFEYQQLHYQTTHNINRFFNSYIEENVNQVCRHLQYAILRISESFAPSLPNEQKNTRTALPLGGLVGWTMVEEAVNIEDDAMEVTQTAMNLFPIVMDTIAFDNIIAFVQVGPILPSLRRQNEELTSDDFSRPDLFSKQPETLGLFTTVKLATKSLICQIKGTFKYLCEVGAFQTDSDTLLPPYVFLHPAKIVSSNREYHTQKSIVLDSRQFGSQDSRLVRSFCGGDTQVRSRCNAQLRTAFVISSAQDLPYPNKILSLHPCDQLALCIISNRQINPFEEVVIDCSNSQFLFYNCICRNIDMCRVGRATFDLEANNSDFLRSDEAVEADVEVDADVIDSRMVRQTSVFLDEKPGRLDLKKMWIRRMKEKDAAEKEIAVRREYAANEIAKGNLEDQNEPAERKKLKSEGGEVRDEFISEISLPSSQPKVLSSPEREDHNSRNIFNGGREGAVSDLKSSPPTPPARKRISLQEVMARKKMKESDEDLFTKITSPTTPSSEPAPAATRSIPASPTSGKIRSQPEPQLRNLSELSPEDIAASSPHKASPQPRKYSPTTGYFPTATLFPLAETVTNETSIRRSTPPSPLPRATQKSEASEVASSRSKRPKTLSLAPHISTCSIIMKDRHHPEIIPTISPLNSSRSNSPHSLSLQSPIRDDEKKMAYSGLSTQQNSAYDNNPNYRSTGNRSTFSAGEFQRGRGRGYPPRYTPYERDANFDRYVIERDVSIPRNFDREGEFDRGGGGGQRARIYGFDEYDRGDLGGSHFGRGRGYDRGRGGSMVNYRGRGIQDFRATGGVYGGGSNRMGRPPAGDVGPFVDEGPKSPYRVSPQIPYRSDPRDVPRDIPRDIPRDNRENTRNNVRDTPTYHRDARELSPAGPLYGRDNPYNQPFGSRDGGQMYPHWESHHRPQPGFLDRRRVGNPRYDTQPINMHNPRWNDGQHRWQEGLPTRFGNNSSADDRDPNRSSRSTSDRRDDRG